MLLQLYIGQMTLVHKAGKLHSNFDALFRLPRDDKKGESNAKREGGMSMRDGHGGETGMEEAEGRKESWDKARTLSLKRVM
jgi:hypothetical protein